MLRRYKYQGPAQQTNTAKPNSQPTTRHSHPINGLRAILEHQGRVTAVCGVLGICFFNTDPLLFNDRVVFCNTRQQHNHTTTFTSTISLDPPSTSPQLRCSLCSALSPLTTILSMRRLWRIMMAMIMMITCKHTVWVCWMLGILLVWFVWLAAWPFLWSGLVFEMIIAVMIAINCNAVSSDGCHSRSSLVVCSGWLTLIVRFPPCCLHSPMPPVGTHHTLFFADLDVVDFFWATDTLRVLLKSGCAVHSFGCNPLDNSLHYSFFWWLFKFCINLIINIIHLPLTISGCGCDPLMLFGGWLIWCLAHLSRHDSSLFFIDIWHIITRVVWCFTNPCLDCVTSHPCESSPCLHWEASGEAWASHQRDVRCDGSDKETNHWCLQWLQWDDDDQCSSKATAARHVTSTPFTTRRNVSQHQQPRDVVTNKCHSTITCGFLQWANSTWWLYLSLMMEHNNSFNNTKMHWVVSSWWNFIVLERWCNQGTPWDSLNGRLDRDSPISCWTSRDQRMSSLISCIWCEMTVFWINTSLMCCCSSCMWMTVPWWFVWFNPIFNTSSLFIQFFQTPTKHHLLCWTWHGLVCAYLSMKCLAMRWPLLWLLGIHMLKWQFLCCPNQLLRASLDWLFTCGNLQWTAKQRGGERHCKRQAEDSHTVVEFGKHQRSITQMKSCSFLACVLLVLFWMSNQTIHKSLTQPPEPAQSTKQHVCHPGGSVSNGVNLDFVWCAVLLLWISLMTALSSFVCHCVV